MMHHALAIVCRIKIIIVLKNTNIILVALEDFHADKTIIEKVQPNNSHF